MPRAAWIYSALTIALIALISGCASTNTHSGYYNGWNEFNRAPAGAEDNVTSNIIPETLNVETSGASSGATLSTKACGDLIQGESNRVALNNEHAGYFLRVDCKSIGKEDAKPTWVAFAPGSTVPQQRSYLTRWRRKAAIDNPGKNAYAYVCFRGEVSKALCEGETSSVAKNVQNFTSRKEIFNKW